MEEDQAPITASEKGKRGRDRCLKKIKTQLEEIKLVYKNKRIRAMFEDEAGFGRINKPKYCWTRWARPNVPCHHIREYRYAYGAVDPCTGDNFFLVMPRCDTVCTNVFLEQLSKEYADDVILLICDGAAWHKSSGLVIPDNIILTFIPPYTPEMNPIEQIWKELRSRGFKNEVFHTLADVVDRLCETICALSIQTVKSITGRQWILELL